LITTGCHEALSVGLRALCQPGDVVALDSPSFHGVMQTLKGLGIKALELPTDPRHGINLPALEMALEQWPIKAIQLTPTCNNPLGYTMPDANKLALLRLAQRFDVAIVEDDVYGDLAYRYPRPRTIKSYDEDGRVLLCSSFSKTLAPGLRIGWMAPGRYLEQALHLKYIGTGATATHPQMALAEFIANGYYEPHVRRLRAQYQRNRDLMIDWVTRYFPTGTRASAPQGGFMLWIELPEGFDTLRQPAFASQRSANRRRQHLFRLRQVPELSAHELCEQGDRHARTSRANRWRDDQGIRDAMKSGAEAPPFSRLP